MGLKLKNDAISRLASGISSSATTIVLTPGAGLLFPTLSSGDYFPATIIKSDGSREIVRVTGRSTDVLTVVRAQEGTVALAFNANDRIELRLTAGTLTDPSGPTAASITSASSKETPADADLFGYADSEDVFKLKKFSWANIKAGMKSTVLNFVYPVGSIYINATSTANPATILGVGTWEEIGAGRVLVGQNTSDTVFDSLGETGGSKDAIVVSHTHTGTTGTQSADHTHSGTTGSAGSHNHTFAAGGGSSGPQSYISIDTNYTTNFPTSTVGDHTHTINTGGVSANHTHSITTDSTGSSGTNANLQPYVVVKMWKRVS